ncbi:MAG: hypothetical protein ACRD07_06210 [Acidimicrobiales bacterium]
MTNHPFITRHPDVDDDGGEVLAEGATWLLDLVAAVDHLRRGYRPGLTVWDALEEALRWTLPAGDDDEDLCDRPDPLADRLRGFLETSGPTAERLQTALRRWVSAMADRHNSGHHWPHPAPRRGFPPPLHTISPAAGG